MKKEYVIDELEHSDYVFLKAMRKKLKSLQEIELCENCENKLNEA